MYIYSKLPVYATSASSKDLIQVLQLHQANHKKNLSDKPKTGFLSLDIHEPILNKIHQEIGIIVAKDGSSVVGFELPFNLNHRMQLLGKDDLLLPMLNSLSFNRKILQSYNLATGIYCVSESHRGKGIPKIMHNEFLPMLAPNFELLVFAISRENPHSYRVATQKLNMVEVSNDSCPWQILVQPTGQ